MPRSKKKTPSEAAAREQSDFDSGWKDALLLALEQFLELLFPDLHVEIDWDKPFRFLDKELREAGSMLF